MELKNIINTDRTIKSHIVHQIDNEGCKCYLCQKIILNQIKTIKYIPVEDHQSQLTKGQCEEYFSQFLNEFYFMDKMTRKIKIIFPQVCVFQKGTPVCLMTKKRQTLPMKIIKNKQKLNAFQIQNFFIEGFIFHNNVKQNTSIRKQGKYKHIRKQHYNFDQALKSQCIVFAKFANGSCQMMTPIQLNDLYKSKQRSVRSQILHIKTMVCSSNYNEIRIHLNLENIENSQYFSRAKNEVKMINEDIKPKDYLYIPQREERTFQDKLRQQSHKKYLEYLTIKLILIYSLRTDEVFKQSLFKFIKDEGESFYLVDIQVYSKTNASRVWGSFTSNENEVKPQFKEERKKRPNSSPERLMKRKFDEVDYPQIPEDQDSCTLALPKSPIKKNNNSKASSAYGRIKTLSFQLKLEPVLMKK